MYFNPHRQTKSELPRRLAAIFALSILALWGFALLSLAFAVDVPPRAAPSEARSEVPPRAAQMYRSELTRNARFVFGLDAPVALFGAQIEQESHWRPNAKSAYANGLAQFTPETAEWISGLYKLGAAEPFNPSWALRALVRYDAHLLAQNEASTLCDRWGFTLSAYNGGQGWVNRDRRLAASRGADPARWFGHVERHSPRGAAAFRENRDYPRRILLKRQPRYANWGGVIPCEGVS